MNEMVFVILQSQKFSCANYFTGLLIFVHIASYHM